jgi:hypothetical protein
MTLQIASLSRYSSDNQQVNMVFVVMDRNSVPKMFASARVIESEFNNTMRSVSSTLDRTFAHVLTGLNAIRDGASIGPYRPNVLSTSAAANSVRASYLSFKCLRLMNDSRLLRYNKDLLW